jgi:hypothetical protein
MKTRPILFSAPMVRAILAGTKTQTRRTIRPQFGQMWGQGVTHSRPDRYSVHSDIHDDKDPSTWKWLHCPQGKVGDRLWVRETWASCDRAYQCHENDPPNHIAYRADASVYVLGSKLRLDAVAPAGDIVIPKWKPSIFLPRWASRILLDVVSVRVERLQAITADDAKAEGAQHWPDIPDPHPYKHGNRWSMETPKDTNGCLGSPQMAFANLWEKLNDKRGFGWDTNPWVWVLTFKRVQP